MRSPAELSSDVASLSGIDWPTVWRGFGRVPQLALREWCAQFGWETGPIDRAMNMTVHLPTGGSFVLYQRRPPSHGLHIDQLEQVSWREEANAVEENDSVMNHAAAVWNDYRHALRDVLGPPSWAGTWESADFPESARWLPRAERLVERQPYRLAEWARAAPADPTIHLWVNVAFAQPSLLNPAKASIRLTLYAPENPQSPGAGMP
jgi:hypothetical protein